MSGYSDSLENSSDLGDLTRYGRASFLGAVGATAMFGLMMSLTFPVPIFLAAILLAAAVAGGSGMLLARAGGAIGRLGRGVAIGSTTVPLALLVVFAALLLLEYRIILR